MLVNLDKFILPIDFIILYIERTRRYPLILGRPFLAMGRILIDVQKSKLILRVEYEQVTFDVLKSMDFPHEVYSCFQISEFDRTTKTCKGNPSTLPLKVCLTNSLNLAFDDEELNECVRYLKNLSQILPLEPKTLGKSLDLKFTQEDEATSKL